MSDNKPNTTENVPEDEMFFDDEDEVIVEELEANKLKKIKDKLKACQSERQEFLDGWQRSKADSVNMKKRMEEEKKNITTYVTEEILQDLFPVLDAFEMVFKDEEKLKKIDPNWVKGIEYIQSQFKSVFNNRGIESFNPLKEPFNESEHHSIELIETDNKKEDHIVLEVVQKGYKIGDRVVRPATVKVGSYTKE